MEGDSNSPVLRLMAYQSPCELTCFPIEEVQRAKANSSSSCCRPLSSPAQAEVSSSCCQPYSTVQATKVDTCCGSSPTASSSEVAVLSSCCQPPAPTQVNSAKICRTSSPNILPPNASLIAGAKRACYNGEGKASLATLAPASVARLRNPTLSRKHRHRTPHLAPRGLQDIPRHKAKIPVALQAIRRHAAVRRRPLSSTQPRSLQPAQTVSISKRAAQHANTM
jgi:hypothetical protein